MKKQFFRVKQLADQAFLRADRSECLNNDELKQADGKVEFIQKTLSEIHKKLPSSAEALEKKKKKYNEHALGNSMIELSSEENEDFLHKLLKQCGDTELQLAEKMGDYESQVEQLVDAPITGILTKELPDIAKHKKNLNKYILDKDSATSRYKNATQHANLKDEMDEADTKVVQSRDALAIEMFGLLRQQNRISMSLIQLLKLQRSYHESALKQLESVIPEMEQMICDKEIKPVFECDLEEHLRHTRRKLAYPLELCVVALTELGGIQEEGLFRLAGGTVRVKRLKLSIDSGCFALPLIQEYSDVHVLASTMKMYLRELPEPLLTYSLYKEWMMVVSKPEEQRVKTVQDILKKLPEQNRNNLAFLIHFLAKLSKQKENKMTSSNISIVMAPNLLWTQQHELNTNMKNCTSINMIVELFINNVTTLFPDDMTSYVTINRDEILDEIKQNQIRAHNNSDSDSVSYDTASPRPNSRKKTKQAPAPPPSSTIDGEILSSYPSGSTTLNRPHKTSLNKSKPLQNSIEELSKMSSDESTHNLVKPVENEFIKPVAAPRMSIIPDTDKNVINQNICVRRDSISKSVDSINIDGELVTMRRSSKEEYLERPGKPAIPVRPASLRANAIPKSDADSMQKTQCSIYNTPHKLQPSIVTIANKPVGHDNQITEKEKFLGHQPQNKYSDINSNCQRKPDLPTKPNHMKSNEKLNVVDEKISNGNARMTSHIRTRSDGNIVDIHGDGMPNLLHTPPSPRSLNKPSQPPPPPPNKTKSEPETTTF